MHCLLATTPPKLCFKLGSTNKDFFHFGAKSGRQFHVPKSNTVPRSNSAVKSVQINLFKCNSSACECVCKLHKLLVYYVTFVFPITVP